MINLFCCMFILAMQSTVLPAADSSYAQPQSTKKTIVDHLDRAVEIVDDPCRIISLDPISTQIIYLLNAQDKLIAFDYMSKSSKWVRKIDPDWSRRHVLTYGKTLPNLEAVAALKPDLIILGAFFHDQVVQVEKVGPCIAFDFHSRPAVDALELIGKAVGKEKRAQELIEYLDKKITEVTKKTNLIPRKDRPTVFYESYRSNAGGNLALSTCGNRAYQQGLIEKAGGINLGENFPVVWQAVDPELLIKWDPDFIVVPPAVQGQKNSAVQRIETNPVLNILSAVKNHRYFVTPDGELSSTANSPEGIIGLQFIAKKLHPDTFAGLNMENEVKEFWTKWYGYRLSDEEVNQILNP
jgi:iron complex transport system substrate-binding protein